MNRLREIGQNVNFWSKWTNFGQKRAKKGPKRFLSKFSLGNYSNRPEMQFKYAKVVKSYEQIERNWPKCIFFLSKNGQKRAKKIFVKTFTG